jgi:hypothetical protein
MRHTWVKGTWKPKKKTQYKTKKVQWPAYVRRSVLTAIEDKLISEQ